MIIKQQDIQDKLKPIDRRPKTLDEHIGQSGNGNRAGRRILTGKQTERRDRYAIPPPRAYRAHLQKGLPY
jgi:hypothetical protein